MKILDNLIPYGREDRSIADEFNIPISEAHEGRMKWLDTYYGARDYLQWCADQVRLGKYLTTPFGRSRRFGLVSSGSIHNLQNEAKNFPVQSSSSDLLLTCAMDMQDQLEDWGVKVWNLVHDSIVMYIPAKPEIISKVGKYCNEVMINKPIELFNCTIPFKTDFEIGLNWGQLFEWDYNNHVVKHEKWKNYAASLEEWWPIALDHHNNNIKITPTDRYMNEIPRPGNWSK